MRTIGFIGLGAMGFPMASNLLKAGFDIVTTFHKNAGPAEALRSWGATVKNSAAQVAAVSDVIITIVPADPELQQVILGEGGVLEGIRPGSVLVDMTSGTPNVLRDIALKLADKGARVLDAPVSGGTTGAQEGTLTIMVGGDIALLEEVRPILSVLGDKIYHVGDVGAGNVVKMVNQLMAAVNLVGMIESINIGLKAGVALSVLYDVIKESSGHSRMLDIRGPSFFFVGEYEPGFKLDLMKKDLGLAVSTAIGLDSPILLGSLVYQIYSIASAAGYGEKDFSAVAKLIGP